jgi:hypothetical protein
MAVNRGGRVVGRRVYRKLEHLERQWEARVEEEEEEEEEEDDDDDDVESSRKEERRARNDMHVIEISARFSCNQSVLAHFANAISSLLQLSLCRSPSFPSTNPNPNPNYLEFLSVE